MMILIALTLKSSFIANFSALQTESHSKFNGPKKNFKKTSPIVLIGIHNQIISGLEIDSSAAIAVQLKNCSNITIRNCKIISAKGNGIDMFNCSNITIQHCYMESISTAIYALECKGIKVLNNVVKNVTGPFPRGQMVQFNDVSGAGNMVCNNRCENILGQSYPEDAINMYKTNGTAQSPVIIKNNWIRGGGPSTTGGGIMLGDNGGSYQIAENNRLVNPGQYGMAISSGTNMQILNNKIYSKKQTFTNVGLYVWNQYKDACSMNIVRGNVINWTNASGSLHNSWNNGNCGKVTGWDTNTFDAKTDSTILPVVLIEKR